MNRYALLKKGSNGEVTHLTYVYAQDGSGVIQAAYAKLDRPGRRDTLARWEKDGRLFSLALPDFD